jgi:phage gp29-like protein
MSKTNFKGLIRSLSGWLGKSLAGPDTDPQRFFGTLYALPNPDPILRQMGQAEKVYYSIAADPHVLGDIRSIRGNFRSHSYRLNAGDEGDSKSLAALELCEQWMERCRPNPLADWLEVMWQMSSSFMTGYRPHETPYTLQDGKYLPEQVLDRPARRFVFNSLGEPLLITRDAPLGKPVEPYQFIISRHMADSVNPYGVAVLSSCFWPWTFKTGGWRYFVKYCERHGLPWPVGRYPMGTNDGDIALLEKALANMVEAGYVVAPEGTGLELLTPKNSSGGLPQENLIDLANREMSKALTGQAMVAELQGAGARAASETAMKRQESIDDSVRDIAAESMGSIFRWVTLFNFGDGIAPPTLEFFQHENAGKDRAETYQIAANMGARPSRKGMLQELGIPEAETPDDELQPRQVAAPVVGAPPAPGPAGAKPAPTKADTNPDPGGGDGTQFASAGDAAPMYASRKVLNADKAADFSGIAGFEFAKAGGMTEDEAIALAAEAADQAIEDQMIAPVARMLAQYEADGRTLEEFVIDLEKMVGAMDDEAVREVLERSLRYSILAGAATKVA